MKSRNLFFFLIAYRYVELHVYLGNRYNILFSSTSDHFREEHHSVYLAKNLPPR